MLSAPVGLEGSNEALMFPFVYTIIRVQGMETGLGAPSGVSEMVSLTTRYVQVAVFSVVPI